MSHHDVIVVGIGLSGLTAATKLAESGARVLVLAKGVGATHLSPCTIDVLGYAPERVERPREALARLGEGHPYSLIGADAIAAAIEWFKAHVPGYTGGLDENLLLPTAVGALRPTAVVPESMVAGDLRAAGGEVLVVGFRALKDFHARLLADNLRRGGVAARAVVLDHVPEGRADVNSLGFARAFDGEEFRAAVAAAVPVGEAERVAFPAVLGLANARVAWADMQARLGRPVFEVPTLPPSVPGIRVFNHFRETLRRVRVQQFFNAIVVAGEREGPRVTGVRARIGLREQLFGCDHVVLATGGFASGGLALDSYWKAHEVALGLEVGGVPDGERFVPDYFDEQPMARAGIAADRELHPAGAENVSVVGATLAGAAPWREKSGDGISLSTGHRAAELILGARQPIAEAAQ